MPEVIDGQLHPQVFELVQHLQGFLGLAHDEVLGDFQLQHTRLEVVVLEQLLDAPSRLGWRSWAPARLTESEPNSHG